MPNTTVKPSAMTDQQLEFATYVEQVFLLKGELPNFEAIERALNVERNTSITLWNNSVVRAYLSKKGIDFERVNREVLSPLQLSVANAILDFNDTRPDHKKLSDFGVETRTYQAWRKDPAFRNYMAKRVDAIVGDEYDEIDRALFDSARSGDIQAIKFIHEYTGRYRGQNGNIIDVQTILIKIQEILVRHLAVEHPTVLEAIGRELTLLSVQDPSPISIKAIQGEVL